MSFFPQLNPQAPLNRGLLGWWTTPPGASRGSTAYDLCRRNDGTVKNGALRQKTIMLGGQPFYGLDFNADTDAQVEIANHASLQLTSWTLAALIRFNAVPATNARFYPFFHKSEDGEGSTANHNYCLCFEDGFFSADGLAHLTAFYESSAGTNVSCRSASGHPVAGVLYHVVGTFDNAADLLTLYLNGKFENSTSSTQTPNSGCTAPLRIGSYTNGTNTFCPDAVVFDARLYDRALSAAEVRPLYLATMQGYQQELHRPQRRIAKAPAAAGGPFPHHIRRSNSLTGGMIGMGM